VTEVRPNIATWLQARWRLVHNLTITYGFQQIEHWDWSWVWTCSRHVCSRSLCVTLSYEGRGLAMGQSSAQGILPKCLEVFIVSEANSEPEEVRRPYSWHV
jgi:hypothetical protein